MNKPRSGLLAVLMLSAALAGCINEDTSDLDARIEDLGSQNTELTLTIAERDLTISELEATVSGHGSNIAGLEATMTLMEEQRDSLLALLSDSQEFANQTIALAEAMNETIAGLHVMLEENATLVLLLQSGLGEGGTPATAIAFSPIPEGVISLDTGGSAVEDTEIGLYDASGELLATNDDSELGTQSILSGEFPAGTYYLAAGAYNSIFGLEGFDVSAPELSASITVNLRAGPFDAASEPIATVEGQNLNGAVWFVITVEANGST